MYYGLGMLELNVRTESGAMYNFMIDRVKTVVRLAGDTEWYILNTSGPIAVGFELRGTYIEKRSKKEVWFESPDKVVEIMAQFVTNCRIKN